MSEHQQDARRLAAAADAARRAAALLEPRPVIAAQMLMHALVGSFDHLHVWASVMRSLHGEPDGAWSLIGALQGELRAIDAVRPLLIAELYTVADSLETLANSLRA